MKTLLIIEDDDAIRDDLTIVIEEEGFQVISAEDGNKGIQLAFQYKPDLIICDVMMPNVDGYQVLQTLRSNQTTALIPFIFLTAKAKKEDMRQGMMLGADDYLIKPVGRSEVLAAIATRLAKKDHFDSQLQQKLDKLRSNITMALPHELRTPLSAILGLSELLRDMYTEMPASDIVMALNDIFVSANRLHDLVQNFILYAQLELVKTNPVKLQEFISGYCIESNLVIASAAKQKANHFCRVTDLKLSLENSIVKIADDKLQKIIEELVDNAFKYSPIGTPVNVISYCDGAEFVVCISNTGKGLTEQQIQEIGAYQQFDRVIYEQQGMGLGLFLCCQIAELHQGSLHIESIPNEQTIVKLTLERLSQPS